MDTLRNCIIAHDGYTLVSVDASQIELRVLAVMSQDPQMLADLKGGDLHQGTAIRMFGFTEDKDEMKARRYKAKQGNFALVYGADSFKLSQMLECSEAEAEDFMAEHKRAYPTLYRWMQDKKAEVRLVGHTTNLFGRIRPMPSLQDPSWKVREKAEREVVNTIIQGTAVDIVKMMGLYLRTVLGKNIKFVLQVHDEWVLEVPDSELEVVLEQIAELKQAFPDYPCGVKLGKDYGSVKEV
jgi:DNA polymerase-1